MRTIGVGLIAVAAVVASVTLARHRQFERRPGEPAPPPGLAAPPVAGVVDLEGIRAAGW